MGGLKTGFLKIEGHSRENYEAFLPYLGERYVKQIQDVIDYCQTGNPEYHDYCFKGSIIAVTDQLGLDKGFQTCQLYPDEFQVECYSFMGSWISKLNLSPNQIIEGCEKAGEKYYNVCLQSSVNLD